MRLLLAVRIPAPHRQNSRKNIRDRKRLLSAVGSHTELLSVENLVQISDVVLRKAFDEDRVHCAPLVAGSSSSCSLRSKLVES